MMTFVFGVCALSLVVAAYLTRYVLARDTGTPEMRRIADAIRTGAEAFLHRQNKTITLLFLIVAGGIFSLYALIRRDASEGLDAAFSFLFGSCTSLLAGLIGMQVSIRTNIRVASAARRSLSEALVLALRGGAVSGLAVVTLSLIGVGGLFWFMGGLTDPQTVPLKIVGFGFGASFVALFAQLGGGSSPRRRTWGPISSVKSKSAFPRTTPGTPPSSPIWWATTWAIARAAAPTSLNPPPPKTSAP